jgi:hypothetical protein
MQKFVLGLLILLVALCSCQEDGPLSAQDIIDRAIEVSGGKRYVNSTIEFDFRKRHYKALRDNGIFRLEREFMDSLGRIRDVYNNNEYKRFINDQLVEVPDTMAVKYTNSVNSVHYFMVLPHGLNDKAVIKTYIGQVALKGRSYYKIKITFKKEGGGKDYEDIFLYWFDTETFKMDYLAYLTYNRDRSIDLRFREAFNERYINGIRFVDYNNYKPENMDVDLLTLDSMFENDELTLLSKIENKNIVVKQI